MTRAASLVDNASVIAEMRLRATPNALSDGAVAAPHPHRSRANTALDPVYGRNVCLP